MTDLYINDRQMPPPDAYHVGFETLGSFERNANGNLVGDLVAVKTTLTVGWKMLDDASCKQILGSAKPFFVSVDYYDPDAGERIRKTMFARPGGGKVALDAGGGLWWRDVGCVFVER